MGYRFYEAEFTRENLESFLSCDMANKLKIGVKNMHLQDD